MGPKGHLRASSCRGVRAQGLGWPRLASGGLRGWPRRAAGWAGRRRRAVAKPRAPGDVPRAAAGGRRALLAAARPRARAPPPSCSGRPLIPGAAMPAAAPAPRPPPPARPAPRCPVQPAPGKCSGWTRRGGGDTLLPGLGPSSPPARRAAVPAPGDPWRSLCTRVYIGSSSLAWGNRCPELVFPPLPARGLPRGNAWPLTEAGAEEFGGGKVDQAMPGREWP